MDATLDRLQAAIEDGEVIVFRYLGGSKPGTTRRAAPIKILSNGLLSAHCVISDRVKMFSIDKIELVDEDQATTTYESAPLPAEPSTLAEALADAPGELRELGWHVRLGPDYCSIHRFFKNGKPRKGPAVTIDYSEFTHESYYDIDTDDFVDLEKPSSRPWAVRCYSSGQTITYSSLTHAVQRFLEFCEQQKP